MYSESCGSGLDASGVVLCMSHLSSGVKQTLNKATALHGDREREGERGREREREREREVREVQTRRVLVRQHVVGQY